MDIALTLALAAALSALTAAAGFGVAWALRAGQVAALTARLEDQEAQGARFEALSNRIFEAKRAQFQQDADRSLGALLAPMREGLTRLEAQVREADKSQFSLKNEIAAIRATHETLAARARGLTLALRGDAKTQGDWGEVQLEKILEESGLRPGWANGRAQQGGNYILQGAGLDLKDEDGAHYRPDAVVFLPGGKQVVIDAKVSRRSYDDHREALEREDADAARAAQSALVTSMRQHITGLAKKGYQDLPGLNTTDFVLMFVPMEGAYALALRTDPRLWDFAWGKRVAIVCPTTLLATLRTVAHVWRQEDSHRNAREIQAQAARLYDKFSGFVEDMRGLGRRLDAARDTYESALNKLSTGRGNLIARAERLRQLGGRVAQESDPP
jgi:DNA recombination protein RmuC